MDVSDDEIIEFAQALEQRRAVVITESVRALALGGQEEQMPTAFHAGYQLACDEILHRLKTEEWDLCLKPVGSK